MDKVWYSEYFITMGEKTAMHNMDKSSRILVNKRNQTQKGKQCVTLLT